MSSALLQCSKLNVLLLQRSQRINRPALHRSRGCQIVGRAAGQSLDLPDEDIYSDYDEPEYVDPNAEEDDGGWQQMMYEEFNPVIVPPDDLFLLDFEKPLAVNERKVREVSNTNMAISQIAEPSRTYRPHCDLGLTLPMHLCMRNHKAQVSVYHPCNVDLVSC